MKIFNTIALCLVSLSLYAQQDELNIISSMRAMHPSEIQDISLAESNKFVNTEISEITQQLINGSSISLDSYAKSAKKSQKYETHSVSIIVLQGYTFHVADHFGAFGVSRVVTCLDGEFRGYQTISDNGVKAAESWIVEWHSKYFVHYYPNGKMYSYPNKQIIELY